ncbi:hypothetical protein [Mycoplasmopsis gallinacea]|uniref:Lipoprotein n=1 Tax=Mycoplasmopsis gallinacea TaxID=29556 RepID=A0A6H0V3T8_9BACT|nr:hypothetical protein [Mycoplasmopsis gallinacea]QIW62648.1 hypothetical protein GOQ20_04555 [Mycoplasmopsis gallinacea]
MNKKALGILASTSVITACPILLVACDNSVTRRDLKNAIIEWENQLKSQVTTGKPDIFINVGIINIEFPKDKSQEISDYNAEALDCFHAIKGHDPFQLDVFISSQNSTKSFDIETEILAVSQLPGDVPVEIRVKYAIKNTNIYTERTYKVNGFKAVPQKHNHYIREVAPLDCEKCLQMYNDYSNEN